VSAAEHSRDELDLVEEALDDGLAAPVACSRR